MIDKKYLPSKNFIKALSTAVGVVLIAIILNYWKTSSATYQNANLASDLTATSSWLNNNIDTDKDGLPDWQEVLYGTDSKKSDTDGDGTSDNEEITLNRDPLKANTAKKGQEATDKIDPNIVAADQQTTEEYQKLNATEKLARNLLSNVIASQPATGQISTADRDALVVKTIEDIPQKGYVGITTELDLNLIPINQASSQGDLSFYANQYYKETEAFRKIMTQDVSIANDYISNPNEKTKEKMKKITDQYQTIINNLIKIPLPALSGSPSAVYHLRIINDLEKFILIDNDMINSDKDIIMLFPTIESYDSTLNDLVGALNAVDIALGIKR